MDEVIENNCCDSDSNENHCEVDNTCCASIISNINLDLELVDFKVKEKLAKFFQINVANFKFQKLIISCLDSKSISFIPFEPPLYFSNFQKIYCRYTFYG